MPASQQPWWSSRIFLLAMVLLAAVPLLKPGIPPIIDLPAHMGRYAIQTAAPDSPLHQWYEFRWEMIGNLGIDLLIVPMAKLFGVELGTKLIILLIPATAVAGMLMVAREAHGELPPSAMFALPLAYGYPFQFGFANFVLSMSLTLLAFALWLRLGRVGKEGLRALLFVPIGIALWFVHSFGWGVLGLLVFAAEWSRRREKAGGAIQPDLLRAGLACLPLMPPMLLMLLWRTGHVAGATTGWFQWNYKYVYLHDVLKNDNSPFDFWSMIFVYALLLAGLVGLGFRRNRLLSVCFFILAIAYFCLPRIVIGSAYADMRLVPFAVAMGLLAMTPRSSSPKIRSAIAIGATLFFAIRIGAQTLTYDRLDRIYDEQLEALNYLPRGARVFTLINLPCLNAPYSSRLDHIDGMAIVRNEAFTNGQWAMAGAQLLKVHHPEAGSYALDPSQILRPGRCLPRRNWPYPEVLRHFPRHAFDYLWLVDFAPDQRPFELDLVSVWQGKRGALYELVGSTTAAIDMPTGRDERPTR